MATFTLCFSVHRISAVGLPFVMDEHWASALLGGVVFSFSSSLRFHYVMDLFWFCSFLWVAAFFRCRIVFRWKRVFLLGCSHDTDFSCLLLSPYPLARNQYISCIRAGANTGATCIRTDMNSLKNLANMRKTIPQKHFPVFARELTCLACIRAKINSPRFSFLHVLVLCRGCLIVDVVESFHLDAAFLLTVGSFLLTVELFYLRLTILAFFCLQLELFAYSFSFLTYSWSFFAHSGKVRLIRALS